MKVKCLGHEEQGLQPVIREALPEATLEQRLGGGEGLVTGYLGKDASGRRKSQCKGPEAGWHMEV